MAEVEANENAAAQEAPKPRARRKMTEEQKAAAAAKRRATIAAKKAAAAAAAQGEEKAKKADKAEHEAKADAGEAKPAADGAEKPAAAVDTPEAPKRRRGRPRLSDEEKARRKAEREAAKKAALEGAQAAASAEAAKDEQEAAAKPKPAAEDATAKGEVSPSADGEGTKPAEGDAPEESKPRRRNNRRRKRSDADDAKADRSAATNDKDAQSGDKPAAEGEAASEGDKPKEKAEGEDSSKQDKQEGDSGDNQGRNERYRDRRNNRRKGRNRKERREIVPSATRDELATLEDDNLVAKAVELGVDPAEYGERDDLVSAVYDALLQAEGFVMVDGILDLMPDGYGFIRTNGYLAGEHDVYVGASMVRRNALRRGDYIAGRVRPARENEKYPALNMIVSLNGEPFEGPTHRVKFAQLTPVYPDERLVMEHGHNTYTARAIDLVAPIGKGQRGLIVSPPKAGKTTVLKDIAAAISANNPEVHLMCLLVDERPEEVTDMERSIDGEVISSTFDMPCENHIAVAELVIERAKRLVEQGQDVVILLDSITRLARAYNLGTPASGRILSGGVDSGALYPPKRFLGAARNIENGGSLTILGTALVDTGSKMDEVIFEEFKGTGNMELKLDRQLADRRIFPAIDPVTSGTRKEELLLDPQEAPLIWGLRRLMANMNNTERAMDMLVKSLRQTEDNREFLVKSAKKANKTNVGANL